MSDETILRDLARREYLENNRQPEHLGGTGPSWRDAYEPPECPECGTRLAPNDVDEWSGSAASFHCPVCDVEYAAEEVE